MVGMLVIPASVESINRRIVIWASLGKKMRPYFQNSQSKKGWRYKSDCLVSQSPDSTSQYYQKTIKGFRENVLTQTVDMNQITIKYPKISVFFLSHFFRGGGGTEV
jgi:hypothetical protein